MHVVIVESPAKAKTINKYLGADYKVLASYGHVRDLPAKDGSVDTENDFAMTYQVDDDSKKQLSLIAKALPGSDTLYLATDPDREGEAIAWHVVEALKNSKALKKDVKIQRVVFTEITKKAVLDAIANPREIDMNLVNAQQARRALDYLVGFTLSPVLWRKLPGSKSAGRVQSVALRLICDREQEIEQFISQEYWDIHAQIGKDKNTLFKAKLSQWKGEKLEKFSITNEAQAADISKALESKKYKVLSVEPKQARRHPYAPFTTSTLQQEASRKLGFGAKKTMQLAQKLYEGVDLGGETVGLITYMRTDGVQVSEDAVRTARAVIESQHGKSYLPTAPKIYKTKVKNAQEAHEAIRPTDPARLPKQVESVLDRDMFRLYELVWKRMIASQMESAVFDQVVVDVESLDKEAVLHATGSVMKFDGFLALYQEGKDDEADDDSDSRRLPPLAADDALLLDSSEPAQHFTEPLPRYSEASLVKKLEELGIGRPSTYASIISVLQERGYVDLDKKRFVAASLGRVVNTFLVNFFRQYVEYDFTATLEDELDSVSEGKTDWKVVLKNFWTVFIDKINESKKLTTTEVISALDEALENYLFKAAAPGSDPRQCSQCGNGRLGLKLGKFGAFIGCSNYPECNYTKQISTKAGANGEAGEDDQPKAREMGEDPTTGLMITLKKGPYGYYIELPGKPKPKRVSLPKNIEPDALTLATAIALLSLPREIGMHPDTGKPIVTDIGRFGPYLLHDKKYTSLAPEDDLLVIGMNRAVDLIANSGKKERAAAVALKVLGNHPESGDEIAVLSGRYGPYVKHKKINASLPKGADVESFTLEEALALLDKKPAGKKKPASRKKA